MSVAEWTPADTKLRQEIWAEYEAQNDLSSRKGQAAGIDPVSGRIWFGESSSDIFDQLKAEARANPLFFVRVGYPRICGKGGHR